MKTKKVNREANKFSLEKFETAKLKNIRLIVGGGNDKKDDPIEITYGKDAGSSVDCR